MATINTQILLCNDTSVAWTTSSKILGKGEMAIEFFADENTPRFKFGDGEHTFAELNYVTMTPEGIQEAIESAVTSASHTHANKDVLDLLTSTWKSGVDEAVTKAGTAVQDVKIGETSIKDGSNIVTLGSAAQSETEDFATAAQGAKAESAIQGVKVNNKTLSPDGSKIVTITKADIGIDQVDNTSDLNKPISTATQSALDNKADVEHTHTKDEVGLGNVTNESKETMFNNAALTGTPTAPTAAEGTSTTQIATTEFVTSAIANGLAASDAMVYKGTLGTGGEVETLPTTYRTGWTYRVIEPGTYAGQVCEIGDLVIALVDRSGTDNEDSDWSVAQTNIDGAITSITGSNGITVTGSGTAKTIALAATGVLAGQYSLVTVDVNGRVTEASKPTTLSELGITEKFYTESQGQALESALNDKVDKVVGKELSSNDYTDDEKEKLSGIAEGATKVEESTNGNIKINNVDTVVYTHPDTAGNKHIPTGGSANQALVYASNGTAIWSNITTDMLTNGTNVLILNGGTAAE